MAGCYRIVMDPKRQKMTSVQGIVGLGVGYAFKRLKSLIKSYAALGRRSNATTASTWRVMGNRSKGTADATA